jgi:hypothetical protein
VDVRHAQFDGNVFRVAAGANIGAREKAFLENYEREFSWGVARQETADLLQMIHDAPVELRELLGKPLNADGWLIEPTAKNIQERYLGSRVISCKPDVRVIMPIVELANHGHDTKYKLRDNGVGLAGQFAGEILVEYQLTDPLGIFIGWGFPSDSENFALSLYLGLEKARLVVKRDRVTANAAPVPFYPEVSVQDGRITLSFMMLGHKKFPRLARGIFYKILRDAGRENPEEAFDFIQHTNRMKWCTILAASELAAAPLARLLRNVARQQLEAMSHNFGVRQI